MKFWLLDDKTLHWSLCIDEASSQFLLVKLLCVSKYISCLFDDFYLVVSDIDHLLSIDIVFILQKLTLFIFLLYLNILYTIKINRDIRLTLPTSALFELVNCQSVPSTNIYSDSLLS